MGRRGRKRSRAAQIGITPAAERTSLPADQHMARVNVSRDDWLAFRSRAVLTQRSLADYLGHLVSKELRRVERAHGASQLDELQIEDGSATESLVLVTRARDTRARR